MKKKLIFALVIAAVVAFCVYFGVCLNLASQIAEPAGNTLEEEIAWEKEHGLWDDFATLQQQEFTVEGDGGYVLHCALVPAQGETNRYVIISHGFGSNRYGAAKYVTAYRDLGFACIIYDVRAHGANDPSTCTLGQTEANDLMAIVSYVRQQAGNDAVVGLHGESMGSSITICSLMQNPDVDFAVADCCFANLYDMLQAGYDQANMGWLLPGVNSACLIRYGFSLSATSPVDAVELNKVPLCLIHGQDDALIPPQNSQQLQAACQSYVELHLVPGAGHAQSRETLGKDAYRQIIADFLTNAGIEGFAGAEA